MSEARPAAVGALAVFATAGVAIGLWGGTPIVTKIAVTEIEPLVVGMLRTVLPAFIVGPLALALGLRLPEPWRDRGWLVLSALGGFVVFPILFTVGLRFTSASHGGLILATLPVITGLIAAVLERRWPGPRWWLGVAIAAAGTSALVGLRLGFTGGEDSLFGDLIILSSCLAASLGYVSGARLSQGGYSTWATTFWGITAGGLVLLPVLAVELNQVAWAAVGLESWVSIAYLALMSSILAYVAWYWALARGGIGRVGLTQFAQPAVSLVLAGLILSEPLTAPLLVAAAVILLGTYIARGDRRRAAGWTRPRRPA